MFEMKRDVSIDSNALTYLVKALTPGYDSTKDSDPLAEECRSMLRIFLYGADQCNMIFTPTVKDEYEKIRDHLKKERHDRFCLIHLHDYTHEIDQSKMKDRKQELFKHHPKEKDCQIVAETELAGLDILLTCDVDLRKRLGSEVRNSVITSPTEFWKSLKIPRGTKPHQSPAQSNPLAQENWWIW